MGLAEASKESPMRLHSLCFARSARHFRQRAWTAFRAAARRSSAVRLAWRAFPPLLAIFVRAEGVRALARARPPFEVISWIQALTAGCLPLRAMPAMIGFLG